MFVYIDESIFERNSEKFYGIGALISGQEIPESVVMRALKQLAKDPHIHDPSTLHMDAKTLSNGYFHASSDSKNAHSHLCRSISRNVNAEFIYSFFVPDRDRVRLYTMSTERIHRLNTLLITAGLLNDVHPIHIFIEGRSSFQQKLMQWWVEELYQAIDNSIYDSPMIPAFYPKITIEIVDKSNPGSQVTDFLLWAVINSDTNTAKSCWITRVGLIQNYRAEELNGPMLWGSYRLNRGCSTYSAPTVQRAPYSAEVFPLDGSLSKNDLIQIYCNAERIIHRVKSEGLPNHAQHLSSSVDRVVSVLRGDRLFKCDDIRRVSRMFLRLFDTLPVYRYLDIVEDLEDFKMLLYARKYLALTLRQDLINGVRTCNWLSQVRNEIRTQNPTLLGLL